jgi:hypothetical protein
MRLVMIFSSPSSAWMDNDRRVNGVERLYHLTLLVSTVYRHRLRRDDGSVTTASVQEKSLVADVILTHPMSDIRL